MNTVNLIAPRKPGLALCAAMFLAAAIWPANASAATHKSEAELIKMLGSSDTGKIFDALDRLPNWYPDSTNALPVIKGLLKDKQIRRKAARSLGDYHATLELEDTELILGLLKDYDPNDVMDGLKALRGLKEPDDIRRKIVSDVVALLRDPNVHVVRDACRTLAELGDKDTIPSLEPLLKGRGSDVRKDAQDAINKLKAKP